MPQPNNYPGRDTEFFAVLNGTPTGPIVGLVELFRHEITPDTPVWYEGLDDWKPALMTSLTRQLFEPGSEFYRAHPEALVIMQGRMTGADPSDMPDLLPDSPPGNVSLRLAPNEQPPKPSEEDVPPVSFQADNNIHDVPKNQDTTPDVPNIPAAEPVYHPQQPIANATVDTPKQPSSYLAWAIVVTLLCCLPAGVAAIIFSCRVNSKWARGEYDDAVRASNRAQLWIILSIVHGLIWSVASMFWAPFGVSIYSIFGL